MSEGGARPADRFERGLGGTDNARVATRSEREWGTGSIRWAGLFGFLEQAWRTPAGTPTLPHSTVRIVDGAAFAVTGRALRSWAVRRRTIDRSITWDGGSVRQAQADGIRLAADSLPRGGVAAAGGVSHQARLPRCLQKCMNPKHAALISTKSPWTSHPGSSGPSIEPLTAASPAGRP